MSNYYKTIKNDYIIYIGQGGLAGAEITESEYNEILSVIHNKPQATETTDYMLKTDLTWEAYEKEPKPKEESTEEDYAIAEHILVEEGDYT